LRVGREAALSRMMLLLFCRRKVVRSWAVVVVAAELGGAQSGIAYRLQVDGQFLRTDHMFVGLIELGLLGLLADALISAVGRRLVHWGSGS
ncbi:hypothetical protein ACWEGQ_19835, partial [Streptomyces seoulensis]